jgi:hypothetical protein
MRAHGVPKWGYGPITGCIWLSYSALNLLGSGVILLLHDFGRGLLERWIRFSEPLVSLVGRFVPAVDSFEAKLLSLSRYWPAFSREAEIPVLRNVVAMNSLLFAIFAAAIIIAAPLEARRAVRRFGPRLLQNVEDGLEHPDEYGLPSYATVPLGPWFAKNTGVHTKEIAIVAFGLMGFAVCYYGFDYVVVYSFISGFTFGLFATSGLYWFEETMIFAICFFVPVMAFSLRANRRSTS